MLAIRLQRTGRKGHANFRVVVQDSRQTPTSGKFVALLGSYDPHSKQVTLAKDKAEFYLGNGAQPSARVARLLKAEGVKLPDWVKVSETQKREVRNPEKLRKNRPAEAAADEAPKQEEPPVAAKEEPEASETVPEQTETPQAEQTAEEAGTTEETKE